jgi:hypothetical protein
MQRQDAGVLPAHSSSVRVATHTSAVHTASQTDHPDKLPGLLTFCHSQRASALYSPRSISRGPGGHVACVDRAGA